MADSTRRFAEQLAAVESDVSGLLRARQLARSSVATTSGEVPIADAVGAAQDMAADFPSQAETVAGLDAAQSADLDALSLSAEELEASDDQAFEARMSVIETNQRVDEAQAAAEAAADTAANALTTSSGKNARRRGVTQPDPPEGGWVQGDQWVRDVLVEGATKPVEVLVWNGTAFVHETLLTGEVLVLGAGGVIRLADGTVSARNLVADAIDGMIITGAIIRTAAAGQRLQLDNTGLTAYSAANAATARLSAAAGGLALTGAITSYLGGNNPRAVLDSGYLLFDLPGSVGAATLGLSPGRITAGGSGAPLLIEHSSALTLNSDIHVAGNAVSIVARAKSQSVPGSNEGNIEFLGLSVTSNRRQRILWEGVVFMNSTQTAPLSDSVSNQLNGIILEWSDYTDGAATNTYWNFTHVHKSAVSRGTFSCPIENALGATNKLVSISDTVLNGHAANINGNRTRTVLRRILGY